MQKGNEIEIKSLENTHFDIIYKGFSSAFIDYEFQPSYDGLLAMLKRRGFDPKLSFAVFADGEIVSLVLNGIGSFDGILTAYDTGTGTVKEYRGRGLAAEVFEHTLPYLRKAGIKQYLLEVLQHNAKAIRLYKKLGFETTREFNYFFKNNEEIKVDVVENSFCIKEINLEQYDIIKGFWDFAPSWQNSIQSIKRADSGFVCLGVFDDIKLIAYCVFEPISGDVAQLAVERQHRRKGVATLLLHEIIKLNKSGSLKFVNMDASCDSMTEFLKSKNIDISGKQFEMIKKL